MKYEYDVTLKIRLSASTFVPVDALIKKLVDVWDKADGLGAIKGAFDNFEIIDVGVARVLDKVTLK